MSYDFQIVRTRMGWFVIEVADVAGAFVTLGAPWATRRLARRYRQCIRQQRDAEFTVHNLNEEDAAIRATWRGTDGKMIAGVLQFARRRR